MRYFKTVLLLMERVCRCWAHRTGPMYVMKPWLGYIAYPGGVHIQVTRFGNSNLLEFLDHGDASSLYQTSYGRACRMLGVT